MKRLPGVAGAFIANPAGQPVAAEVPPLFDEITLEAMAMDGMNAIETLRSELPSCHELRIDTALMTVLIKDLSGSLLFTLVDHIDEASSIRIATNVVAKRYAPEADAPVATSKGSSSGEGVFSLGGGRKKEKPPKPDKPSSGGGIWG